MIRCLKRNFAEPDLFDRRFCIPLQQDRLFRTDPEIGKGHIADVFQFHSVLHTDPYRTVLRLDDKIGEDHIAQIHEPAVFPFFREITDRIIDVDPVAASAERDIAEGAAADRIIAGAADPDPLTPAVEHAVGDIDIFADRTVIGEFAHRTDYDAVVACPEETVTHRDASAADDVQTVVVDHLLTGCDADPVHMHIFAVEQQKSPAGRIREGDILEFDIRAVEELNHAGTRMRRLGKNFSIGNIGIVEFRTLSIDLALPGDCDIFRVEGCEQDFAAAFRCDIDQRGIAEIVIFFRRIESEN